MLSLDESWWDRPKGKVKGNKAVAYAAYGSCNLPLAQAYVPLQPYGRLYSPREALEKGTLFVDLYRPYGPCKGGC